MDVQQRKSVNTNENEEKPIEKKPKKVDKRPLGYQICKVVLLAIPVVITAYFVFTFVLNRPDKAASNVSPETAGKTPVEAETLNKKSDEKPDKKPADKPEKKSDEKLADKPDKKLQPPDSTSNMKTAPEQSNIKPKTEKINDKGKVKEKVPFMQKVQEVATLYYEKDTEAAFKYLTEDDDEEDLPAMYEQFQALSKLAEAKRSKAYLEEAIKLCINIVSVTPGRVSKEFHIKVGKECAELQLVAGRYSATMRTFKKLILYYPDELPLLNHVGFTCFRAGEISDARYYFEKVLDRSPNNGFAKVQLGLIKKIDENDIPGSIPLISEGISSNEPEVIDGRFFAHLGDAYYKNGDNEKAFETYEEGVKKGVFLSKWQRSVFNVDRLESRPWWTYQQTGHADMLQKIEKNWEIIRDEGLAQVDAYSAFTSEDKSLIKTGDWKQLTLYAKGQKNEHACRRVPKTCKLVSEFVEATNCTRGQIKFSVMHGGSHVWPHCGPSNCRIRAHLGLVIPKGAKIRVKNEERTWEEGKFIIFDDSFETELWHNGDDTNLILIVDMWHPDLTEEERTTLSPLGF